MKNIFIMTLHDPVLLLSVVVLAGTIVLLLWAVRSLKNAALEQELIGPGPEKKDEKQFSEENQEVVGARLHEISNQLCELNQKIGAVEQNHESLRTDKTMKLDASQGQPLSGDTAAQFSETLERLEAKLDGILKLLVNLTDSNGQR